MIITIDLDGVVPTDEKLWLGLIQMSLQRKHRIVVNSGRPKENFPPTLPLSVPLICTSGRAKAKTLENRGVLPDIWIDNQPARIHDDFIPDYAPAQRGQTTIAIDYDRTWTADPGLWFSFSVLALRAKHNVIIATGRDHNEPLPPTFPGLAVYYTSGMAKSRYLADHRIFPDVWIDDRPDLIHRNFGLAFP